MRTLNLRNAKTAGMLLLLLCLGWSGAANAVATGTVHVTLTPADAVTAGAQWRVNGGAWLNSGDSAEVVIGTCTVSFKEAPGWATPTSQSVSVSTGSTTNASATYRKYDLCEGVGACNRTWQLGNGPYGGGSWFVQEAVNHDGHNALQSGPVDPNQMTSLTTTVEGPCTVSFWWKSSCNNPNASLYYYLDSTFQSELRGEIDWAQRVHVLEAGTHTITWYFYRWSSDTGGGSNCGWIDQFLVQEADPPTGSVTINSGAASTNSANVTLGLSYADAGSGVTGMRFSNDGATWSAWETPAATRTWTLPDGDGYRTARVQFRDKAGNISAKYTDYILLDKTAPTGSIVINDGAKTTPSQIVTLKLTWDDAGGSGVIRMRFSNDGMNWSPWEPLSAVKSWTLAGTDYQTVRVQFRDAAGNVSLRYNDYIKGTF